MTLEEIQLMVIKKVSEIAEAVPQPSGKFFYYDETGVLKKAPMTEIYNLVSGSQSLGTITPSSTIPAEGNVWGFAAPGTYPNAGNLTISPNTLGILTRVGGTWSKMEVAMPNLQFSTLLNPTSTDKAETGKSVAEYVKPVFDDVFNIKQRSGISFKPTFERGGLDASGNEVAYTSGQPRMRTPHLPLQSEQIVITTTDKEFYVVYYDVTKRRTGDSLANGYVKNIVVNAGTGFFRVVARNANASAISDADLNNSVNIDRFNQIFENKAVKPALFGAIPYETKNISWENGIIENTTEEITLNKYSVTSSILKNESKNISISVNSGFAVGVRIYNSQEANPNTLVGYYSSAQSLEFTLDGSYYIRIFIKAADTTVVLNPSSFPEVGLAMSGIKSTFTDFIAPAKERTVRHISQPFKNGIYDLTTKAYSDNAKYRSFLYNMGATGAYIYLGVNPEFVFDVVVWNGAEKRYSEYNKKFLGFYIKSGDSFTMNIRKSNQTEFDGTENIGFIFDRIDEKKKTVGFMNLNSKIHKSHFNADEYGLRMDNADNTPALQDLCEYVFRHGGGTIILPIGIYDFQDRIQLKSNVDLIGYGAGKTVLRMKASGTKKFSLFDNKDVLIKNCRYRDFTVDGYDLNPTDNRYTTDMKAFNFHLVMNCWFEGLQIQGTPATGLGIDYLFNVYITNNHIKDCGRLWVANSEDPNMQGGSGIGIGTGAAIDENFVVAHNIVENAGQNGIFIEDQGIFSKTNTPAGRGIMISNNIVRNGRWNGLAARGNTRANFVDNIVYSNVNAGFFADKYLREIKVDGNQFTSNRYGLQLRQEDDRGSYDNSFNNNLIKSSTIAGMLINGTNARDFDFKGNSLVDNAKGIVFEGNSDNFFFDGNKIRRSAGNDLEIKGTHNDLVFKNTSYRGSKSNTATFTGNNSEVNL